MRWRAISPFPMELNRSLIALYGLLISAGRVSLGFGTKLPLSTPSASCYTQLDHQNIEHCTCSIAQGVGMPLPWSHARIVRTTAPATISWWLLGHVMPPIPSWEPSVTLEEFLSCSIKRHKS
ncbi:hypothetical protein TIFTF001_025890 [Ficus carica]|uniref:Uncharacterized protein n=1 Tax=Ficus carica TaxID=3494 RepID=A0AA88AQK3_FICCA|nr:hypothetical protein TIFTF001_025890 [Ficus carica]